MTEPHFDPVANFDQALAGMVDMAKLTWAYFFELRVQGFTTEQALELTKTHCNPMTMPKNDD